MNAKRNAMVILTAFVVMTLILNPETIQLAIFIDAVGLDMFLLLIQFQFLSLLLFVFKVYIKPVFQFFLKFSLHPFFVPTWSTVKQYPGSIAFVFPAASIIMFFLLAGFPVYVVSIIV